MGAYGLQTHIWNNNIKSVLLLAGFPILLMLLIYGLILGFTALTVQDDNTLVLMQEAWGVFEAYWPFCVILAGLWFVIAAFFHQKIINATTGAKSLSRKENKHLYNMLENLCIETGMTMPKLNIINSPALNAFASGIDENTYTITLTKGIIDALDEGELRAVMAHELTHIRNKDVRLLIIAVIFVGIFSFFGEIIFRNMFRIGTRMGGYSRKRNGNSRGGGIAIIIAIAAIVVAYLLAIAIRFSLSRKREFLADAGAVDLTKKPDAMIAALEKISGRSQLDVPNDVQQMCIENTQPFAGIFMTHPPIEKRIQALQQFAAGVSLSQ